MTVAAAVLAFTAGIGSPGSAQDRPQIRPEPGLWSATIKTTFNGSPQPGETQSQCQTQADIDELMRRLARADQDQPCTVRHSATDRTLSFTVACKRDGVTERTLEGSWVFENPRHFSLSGRSVTTIPEIGKMELTTTIPA